jgi:hypothetical protein
MLRRLARVLIRLALFFLAPNGDRRRVGPLRRRRNFRSRAVVVVAGDVFRAKPLGSCNANKAG